MEVASWSCAVFAYLCAATHNVQERDEVPSEICPVIDSISKRFEPLAYLLQIDGQRAWRT
jgi:hypothetical protein